MDNTTRIRLLSLTGSHYQMGLQHGVQVAHLRAHIRSAMEKRLQALAALGNTAPYEQELLAVWEEHARPTLDMLRGIAQALALPWDTFFRYTVASYLEDTLGGGKQPEGCTAWAATAPITRDGTPLLAKNRDYRPEHLPLQMLARAAPARGYRYLFLTSAGSPGVFSSGMNEVGLAVADTHVVSLDVGPGVARYSLMMDIVEQCATVPEALDYIRSVPHMGEGNLVLADAEGNIVAVELGHSRQNVIPPDEGAVVATNHFVTEGLADRWRDTSPPHLRGNSAARRQATYEALREARGNVDDAWARAYMASHRDPLGAMCRHLEEDGASATIGTTIYLPTQQRAHVLHGNPCHPRDSANLTFNAS